MRTLSASMGYPLGAIDWSFPLTLDLRSPDARQQERFLKENE